MLVVRIVLETVGYFFCLQDRSLLCRRCDVVIHTANPLVSAHHRFLLTGVKVGLEATEPGPSSPLGKSHSHSKEKNSGLDPYPVPKRTTQLSTTDQSSKNLPVQASSGGDFSSSKLFPAGGSTAGSSISLWLLDEYLELRDYTQNFDFMDHGSSKADYGKYGDSECSPILGVADMELEGDGCTGLGPDTFWAVPEIPSPPTASGTLGYPGRR